MRKLLDFIRRQYDHPTDRLERLLMPLSAQVQSLVDAVTANTNAVAAAVSGLAAEATQIKVLQAQIATLQAGQPIDADDLAAITTAVTQLGETKPSWAKPMPRWQPPCLPTRRLRLVRKTSGPLQT